MILIVTLWGLRFPLAASLMGRFGEDAIWWSFPASSLLSMLLAIVYYRFGHWRKARMMTKLVEYGFFPRDDAARKELERLNPYQLRAKGLHEALTPAEFGRALFHLNQRRGFKSNRKTDQKDNDSGALKTAIKKLRETLAASDCQTVGELLWKRLQAGEGTRARYRETRYIEDGKNKIDKSYDFYIDRQMVADEFDALWAK